MRCRPGFLPLLAWALLPGGAGGEPVRLSTEAFGSQAEIEIRDLPAEAATAAARDALREIFEISQLLEPGGSRPGGFGVLNAGAGGEPVPLEPRAAELLRRGLQFCFWTRGAHGPLGGQLYSLWGSQIEMPDPTDLRDAVISAQCDRVQLQVTESDSQAALAAGSQARAIGFGRGFALDRAAAVLKEAGVENAWLEIDGVWLAMGPGASGEGWLGTLPPAPGRKHPIDRIWLRDQAFALILFDPNAEQIALRPIDQRTGVPPVGVVAVATVTEQAIDAEALAVTLFITGQREGQMRLGGLDPRPSVLWLLGQGKGEPVESTYRWSEVGRMKRLY